MSGQSARVPYLNLKLQGFGSTIFAEMTALAAETNSINLGQGFPNYDGPQGTYFITVDIRPIQPDGDGFAFCRELPHKCGVVGIPNVVFYDRDHQHEGRHLVRFAFCQQYAMIDDAVSRLKTMS